jgi:hypothetical protein
LGAATEKGRRRTMRRVLLTLALVCFVSMLSSYVAAIEDKSLVLYLTFDEGSGKEAQDLSQYGNNGNLQGDPKWTDGKYGKALQFEGEDSYVEVANSDSLNFGEAVTMMCWAYSTAWEGDGDQWIDKGAHDSKPSCYGIMVYQQANLYIMAGDGGARHDLITPDVPPTEEWYHIAGVYDGESFMIYLNGELHAENKDSFAFVSDNQLPLQVGRGVNRAQYTFAGMIDEVLVYNRALPQDEIKEVMEGKLLSVDQVGKLSTTWGNIKFGY